MSRGRQSWITRFTFVASAVLFAGLILAACGGSEKSATDAATTSPGGGEANAASGTPFKIALVVNATGPGANGEENTPKVIEAWTTATNAEGGVGGHPVEIVEFDTKGEASTATSVVKEMVSTTGIDAVIMFDAETESLYAAEITKAGLPVIGGMGYNPEAWGKLPNWLSITTSFPAVIYMPMVAAQQLGAGTTAFAVCAEYPTCSAAAPLAEEATKKLDMAYGGTLKLNASAPDYTAECLQIKERGVGFVALGLQTSVAMRLVNECATQGYEGKWGIFDGTVWPKEMNASDAGVPMTVQMTSFPWFARAPQVKAYVAMMEREGIEEGVWADPHSTAAYATLELFKKALAPAGESIPGAPTPQDVIKAYGENVKDETLGGLLPQPVTFKPNKPEEPITCYWFANYEQGKFKGAELGKPQCDPAALAAQG